MLKPLIPVGSLALVLLLSGCGDPTTTPSPPPSPSSTPVFASDEEALAAAEEAYAAYLAVSDAALADYDTGTLAQVATGTALKEALESVADFERKGQRFVGTTSLDSAVLTGLLAPAEISLYGCLDLKGTDVVDASGASVVPSGRPTRFPLEIQIVWKSGSWLVASDEVWSGSNFCE